MIRSPSTKPQDAHTVSPEENSSTRLGGSSLQSGHFVFMLRFSFHCDSGFAAVARPGTGIGERVEVAILPSGLGLPKLVFSRFLIPLADLNLYFWA